YGAYGALQYGTLAKTTICAFAVSQLGLTGSCNPDFNIGVIGGNVVWTPVKNLAFTLDVNWTNLDQKYSGVATITPPVTVAKPAAVYELKEQNSVTMLLRAQRNLLFCSIDTSLQE